MTQLVGDSVLEALRERWRAEGILNGRGATESEIAAFEARYGIVLPPHLRQYFDTVNRTVTGQYGMDDQNLLGFWHLDHVHTFAEESGARGDQDAEARRTFALADHSIWCFGFGIQLSNDHTAATPIVCDLSTGFQKVAGSLTEFFSRYLHREESVLYPTPSRA